jgi:hypothetical protein
MSTIYGGYRGLFISGDLMFVNSNKTLHLVDRFLVMSEALMEAPASNLRLTKMAQKMNLDHYGGGFYGPKGKKGVETATHKSQDGKIVPLTDQEKQAVAKKGIPDETPKPTSRLGAKKSFAATPTHRVPPEKPKLLNVNLKPVDNIIGKKSSELTDKERDVLRGNNIQKVQKTLYLTKEQAAADKKNKANMEGIGAGTPDSRAGECAIIDGLSTIKNKLATKNLKGAAYEEEFIDELNRYYDNMIKRITPNMFLTKEWVEAARASAKQIVNQVGAQNIVEVAWDTPEGRALVGSDNHGTSSDMFILDKKGNRWGISLKKSANVFLMNRGNNQAMMDVAESMKEQGAPESEIDEFMNQVSDAQYKEDIRKAIAAVKSGFKKDAKMAGELKTLAAKLQKGKIPDTKKAGKYLSRFGPDFFERDWTGDDLKLITRLLEYGQLDDSTTTFQKMEQMRNLFKAAETGAANRWIEQIQTNPVVSDAVKNLIVKGTHLFDVLEVNLGEKDILNKFVQVYGEGEDGAVMNLRNVGTFFTDNDKERAVWDNLVLKAKGGDKKSKNLINQIVSNRIRVDFSKGSQGQVLYKRSNPSPPPATLEYPIFSLRIRVKELGVPPSVQLEQNQSFVIALKYGTDINKWPPRQKENYYTKEFERAVVDLAGTPSGNNAHRSMSADVDKLRQTLGSMIGDKKLQAMEQKIVKKFQAGGYDDE